MEDQEPLESVALLRQPTDALRYSVNDLSAAGVMTARVVISRVLFTAYQLLWMEEMAVGSAANLVCEIVMKEYNLYNNHFRLQNKK